MTKTPSAAVSSASQPVTLRQIAVRAKASVMTVSRALGNRARVAASTRERVLRIAEALGYRPDPEIAMDCVGEGARRLTQEYVLKNAFGFGGCNACIVLRRLE